MLIRFVIVVVFEGRIIVIRIQETNDPEGDWIQFEVIQKSGPPALLLTYSAGDEPKRFVISPGFCVFVDPYFHPFIIFPFSKYAPAGNLEYLLFLVIKMMLSIYADLSFGFRKAKK